ncbi:ATPase [Sulfitobacter sp. F26204]|uniref:BadF/BadG/BcrA/BcrD ATPase family protein n=1 Tax=Sulfitobacter sp. F26204 TaxID=2996014 RepID=UPI00225E627E|nr:BadF/BadG/BcrA/BcrD ATPase family protein [Sulfitobacter sp. F26204]MCX7561009.1 ATPase [Sulfitobacter sp. F26204]
MDTSIPQVIVAADGGGSGCRAAAGTVSRGIIAQAIGGSGNIHSDFRSALANLTDTIDRALLNAGLQNTSPAQITAHLGVAGAHSTVEISALLAALPYGRVTVSGDRDTSVRGALGDADGFLVALGTGTIVARQENLQMRTVGGWGFHLSDQASGAWLGRRLLEEVVLAEDGLRAHTELSRRTLKAKGGLVGIVEFSSLASPADYAQYARLVIEAVELGDTLALGLIAQGAAYLEKALNALGFETGDWLTLAGGVGPHYAKHLPNYFKFNLQPPQGSALDGAFAMALQLAKGQK